MCRDKEEILEIQLYIYPCIRLNRLPASIVKNKVNQRRTDVELVSLFSNMCVFPTTTAAFACWWFYID